MDSGNPLQYVTGPIQLVGFAILVLTPLVPRLTGSRIAQKNQRTLVVGLLVLGALAVIGGIWRDGRREVVANKVEQNVLHGDGNVVGISSHKGAPGTSTSSTGSVINNEIIGNRNVVGVGSSASGSSVPSR